MTCQSCRPTRHGDICAKSLGRVGTGSFLGTPTHKLFMQVYQASATRARPLGALITCCFGGLGKEDHMAVSAELPTPPFFHPRVWLEPDMGLVVEALSV